MKQKTFVFECEVMAAVGFTLKGLTFVEVFKLKVQLRLQKDCKKWNAQVSNPLVTCLSSSVHSFSDVPWHNIGVSQWCALNDKIKATVRKTSSYTLQLKLRMIFFSGWWHNVDKNCNKICFDLSFKIKSERNSKLWQDVIDSMLAVSLALTRKDD